LTPFVQKGGGGTATSGNHNNKVETEMSTEEKHLVVNSGNPPVAAGGNPSVLPFSIPITPVATALELYDALKESTNDRFRHAVELIEQCLNDEANNGIQGLAFSFNGGKDCTVVLHLLRAVFAKKGLDNSEMLTVYFNNDNDFPELKEFMNSVTQEYGFNVQTVENGFKEGIKQLIKDHPKVKFFFMGQRKNDPHGKTLKEINISDVHKGWPEFYRVNPILEWGYKDVWTFLKGFGLSYCSLYDHG
jgi:FAD synthetase